MKSNFSIRLKAALLLTIFSLNIVVGFACSVGFDTVFNSGHHHGEEATEINAAAHDHHGHEPQMNSVANHHGQQSTINHHQVSFYPAENCCSREVSQLTQADKVVPQPVKAVNPLFVTAFIDAFYYASHLYYSLYFLHPKFFLQNYHPPIAAIYIAVQNFRI